MHGRPGTCYGERGPATDIDRAGYRLACSPAGEQRIRARSAQYLRPWPRRRHPRTAHPARRVRRRALSHGHESGVHKPAGHSQVTRGWRQSNSGPVYSALQAKTTKKLPPAGAGSCSNERGKVVAEITGVIGSPPVSNGGVRVCACVCACAWESALDHTLLCAFTPARACSYISVQCSCCRHTTRTPASQVRSRGARQGPRQSR